MTEPSASAHLDRTRLYGHLGYLDGLRGIAILLVFVVHTAAMADLVTARTFGIFFVGQRGVELFYEVSAFTLFLSLSGARPQRRPLLNFYLRRFFRIAPAFYVLLLLEYLLVGRTAATPWRYVASIFFLNGFHYRSINLSIMGCWSVAVESSFYLLVPLLFRRITTVSAAATLLATSSVVTMVLDYALAHRFPALREYFTFLWIVAQLPVFFTGIFAFTLWKQLRASYERTPVFWTPATRYGISAMLLLFSFLLLLANVNRHNEYLIPGSFCFLPLLLAGELYEWPLLFNRFTRTLGKVSYSMYLSHFFVMKALLLWAPAWTYLPHRGYAGGLVFFVLLLVFDLPLSWLLWRTIEVPGIALGRAVLARLEHTGQPAVPLPSLQSPLSTPDAQF